MAQISILGCGWLGLPLAQHLIEQGYRVKGSTTSPHRISELKHAGIEAFVIVLSVDETSGSADAFLADSTVLIIDIPPKLRADNSESFFEKIKTFIQTKVINSTIKKVLFISSTSVYGEEPILITEKSIEKPETLSGKELLQTEHFLEKQTAFKTTILRFGGLVGPNRHPAKSLAGKMNIALPNAPINLIHQNDCIAIISTLLENEVWGEKWNAVTPFHPNRKEYYAAKAKEFGLEPPHFETNDASGKIIDSSKLMASLNYSFMHKEGI